MIDKKWIGHDAAGIGAADRAGRLRFFAKAIGETDPDLHRRSGSARCRLPAPAGAADLPVRGRARRRYADSDDAGDERQPRPHAARRAELQLPRTGLRRRHGAPSSRTISDIYDKKNGALEFVVKTSRRHQPARRAGRRDALGARRAATAGGHAMTQLAFATVQRRRHFAAAAAAAGQPHHAGAVRRRLGRPQPDPHRHRRRAQGRHARRVRAGHAGHGLARPPAHGWAPQSPAAPLRRALHRASRTWATRSPAAAAWSRSSSTTASSCVRIELQSANQFGQAKIVGEALVALP